MRGTRGKEEEEEKEGGGGKRSAKIDGQNRALMLIHRARKRIHKHIKTHRLSITDLDLARSGVNCGGGEEGGESSRARRLPKIVPG